MPMQVGTYFQQTDEFNFFCILNIHFALHDKKFIFRIQFISRKPPKSIDSELKKIARKLAKKHVTVEKSTHLNASQEESVVKTEGKTEISIFRIKVVVNHIFSKRKFFFFYIAISKFISK